MFLSLLIKFNSLGEVYIYGTVADFFQ